MVYFFLQALNSIQFHFTECLDAGTVPTVIIENTAEESIATSGDVEYLSVNEHRSSPKLEFIETEYIVKLKASTGHGIIFEGMSIDICKDNSCVTRPVKPEKGEQCILIK